MLIPILLCGLAIMSATIQQPAMKISLRSATPQDTAVPRYHRFELDVDLSSRFKNPFDPEEIEVWAEFRSPAGKKLRINGFYFQDYRRTLENGVEKYQAHGLPCWRIRFAPGETGAWNYTVHAQDKTGTAELKEAQFVVTASRSPGFIGRSLTNPSYFAYTDGTPTFPVGLNVCWSEKDGLYAYTSWLNSLANSGGNWIRVWMSNWNTGLEWTRDPANIRGNGSEYHGVCYYNLVNAYKADTLMELAEKRDIQVMLCLGTYGELKTGGFFNEGEWKNNPYNSANGGPCAKPEEIWTDVKARKLYRQRLRYLIARYGSFANLHSWEFWNEAEPPTAWVQEMASYIKGTRDFEREGAADPYHHLVTTTYGTEAIWKLPEMDFTQSHRYGMGEIPDFATVVLDDAAQYAAYGKPHLLGEFGIDWRKPDTDYDKEGKGINLHNALWASTVSGASGTAMIWWWDNYIDPKKLWPVFSAVQKFTSTIPWTEGSWKTASIDPAKSISGVETFSDLKLPAAGEFGKLQISDYVLTPFGEKSGLTLPRYLFGPVKADMQITPTFHVNFTKPGTMTLHVDKVSQEGRIKIRLDGQQVKEIVLPVEPPKDPAIKPEYEKTEFVKEYNLYQAVYNRDYVVNVPAGEHTITLENTIGDWVAVDSITLSAYRSSLYPELSLRGLVNGDMAILWAQNRLHNWKNENEKKPMPPIASTKTLLHGLPSGSYSIEWWDTAKGIVLRKEAAVCANGDLVLTLPEIETDIAARILPVK